MFLSPTPPRLTRRSRLEHLVLLCLRCLVICLLALGFARPFLKRPAQEPPSSGSKRILVLVDTSASMRRANLWSEARARAESVLRKASAMDEVALVAFDRQVKPLLTFEQWRSAPTEQRVALALSRLTETSPGWSATQTGNALISAAEMLPDSGGRAPSVPGQIVLITDLQEGSRLEPLQGYQWPRHIELSLELIKPPRASNASLQWVNETDDSDSRSGGAIRIRVSNAADSKREQFQVGWARADGQAFPGEPTAAYVPAGQSRTFLLPSLSATDTVDRIILRGDEEDFDNTVFAVPPETARLNVLYFGSESDQDTKQPFYFLARAFQETRRQAVQLRRPAEPLQASEASAASLFVVAGSLSDADITALRDQISSGKTACVALTSAAHAATLAGLLRLQHLDVEEARPNNYAMLAEVDFRHLLFTPFADPRFSDFTKIHFWRYRRVETSSIPNARAIASFDSGDPAVLDIRLGNGRLLVLTSGWHPADSQLALSSKFVPLFYSMLEMGGAPVAMPAQYRVGDVVPIAPATDSPLTIRLPNGSEVTCAAGETNFSRTDMPGVYTVWSSGAGELRAPAKAQQRFAVNLDPAESRTTPLSLDDLERLGAPVSPQGPTAVQVAQGKLLLHNAELEERQKLWRWIILVTLAVLLFETWLAGRTARQSPA
jgi:hypothetical protein